MLILIGLYKWYLHMFFVVITMQIIDRKFTARYCYRIVANGNETTQPDDTHCEPYQYFPRPIPMGTVDVPIGLFTARSLSHVYGTI